MEMLRFSHVIQHSRLLPPIATATMVQEHLCCSSVQRYKWQLGRDREELVVILDHPGAALLDVVLLPPSNRAASLIA